LILRKISKFDAIRCQILRLKYTKFDFRWGFAPDPAGEVYSAPPDPLTVFKGALPTSKGRGGKGKENGIKGEGKGGKERICQTNVKLLPHALFWWYWGIPRLVHS